MAKGDIMAWNRTDQWFFCTYESRSKKNRTTGGFWFKNSAQVDIGLRCQILSAKTQGYTYA